MDSAIAEVIESTTRGFVAEVFRDAAPPALGTWIQVAHSNGTMLYAVVSHVELGSVAPNRQAHALGLTEDELQREIPQVLELLRTTFRALVVAYRDGDGTLRQMLPPQPAHIHGRVEACAAEHVRAIVAPYDFLRTLGQYPDPAVSVDDLLVAVLRQLEAAHASTAERDDTLVAAGRTLSRLFDDDHERLHSILRRTR